MSGRSAPPSRMRTPTGCSCCASTWAPARSASWWPASARTTSPRRWSGARWWWSRTSSPRSCAASRARAWCWPPPKASAWSSSGPTTRSPRERSSVSERSADPRRGPRAGLRRHAGAGGRRSRRAGGRGGGAPRPERRGQDDAAPHPGPAAPAGRRPARSLRHRRGRGAAGASPADRLRRAREPLLSGSDRGREPGVLRAPVRRARRGGPHRRADRLGGARGSRSPAGARLLARHGAAARARTRAAARAGPPPPRRALRRPRPRGGRGVAAPSRRAARRGPCHRAHHARPRARRTGRDPARHPPPRARRMDAGGRARARGGRRGLPGGRRGARLTVRGALAIFAKDLRIEWRTRESLASVFVLGVLLVVVLTVAQAVVVPLAGLFLHADLWPVLPGLLAVLLLGNLGFAALATLFAAVAARTRARETLLPLLLLPLALPLLIGAVQATQAVLAGGLGAAREAVAVLVAFDVIFAVAGWLLFAYVVRD